MKISFTLLSFAVLIFALAIPTVSAASSITGVAKCTGLEQFYYTITDKSGSGFATTNSYYVFY